MRYPVFLINLDRQPGRLRFMTAQLEGLGIAATRIPAFNGRAPDAFERSAAASYAALTGGEIGCFESHRAFWKAVIDGNYPGAIVLEDDVLIASDFADLDFTSLIEAGCDIVKLDEQIGRTAAYGAREISIGVGRSASRMHGDDLCTACYFVTQRGARKLLAASKDSFVPVDHFMFEPDSKAFWSLKVWKLRPAAAQQYRSQSADGPAVMEDSISASRSSGVEQERATGTARDVLAWRLRRLLQLDIRAIRKWRRERKLAAFARREPIEQLSIPFHTAQTDHIRAAEALLAQE